MKTTDFIKESIGQDADEMHRDHEVQMARVDCYNAAKYAIELHKILHHIAESQGLEGWVSEKITLANDYLRTVHEYLTHEMAMAQEESLPAFTFESAEAQYQQGVTEGPLSNPGQNDTPVANAITRRIIMQRTDLLAKYGPEKVAQAIDEVADFVGDVDEIGSSDVSGWVKHVEQMLGNSDLAETQDLPLKDKADYHARRKALQNIQLDPNTHKDPKLKAELARKKAALEKEAQDKGLSESFGATSAGGIASVVAGKGNKPGTGVPKKVGNIMRRIAPKVGKGIY